jgi:hypothetical protein
VRNIWLARLGVLAWLKIVHPVRFFPDPTESSLADPRIHRRQRRKFPVGIQRRDDARAVSRATQFRSFRSMEPLM